MANQLIARTSVTLTASYGQASTSTLIFTGTMSVPSGTSLLQDTGSGDVALVSGVLYPLVAIDLSKVYLKNSGGGNANFVGGTYGPPM